METILISIINHPKDGFTFVALLALFVWCMYRFGIISEQIKNIIDTQLKDNKNVIEKLDDLKDDIKDLSDRLFQYVRDHSNENR